MKHSLKIAHDENGYTVAIGGVFDIHTLPDISKELDKLPKNSLVVIDLGGLDAIDTAAALYLEELLRRSGAQLHCKRKEILETIELAKQFTPLKQPHTQECSILESIGLWAYKKYDFLVQLLAFIGILFAKKFPLFFTRRNFRYKEILFEINQSALRAVGIVALTSFLVGVVIAYQSAVQLKIYGANIFIVDMLGISILRELAPMITAIVIAGRSGSAYTAEIGAMKITQELDAMRTMGFDPYFYLVIPRIIALAISLPILIFVADIAGMLGGMIISNTQLDISFGLFLDRFSSVIALKHFVIGEIKGPFFAFLIAIIAIYRGFMVKDDTQSIGKNTTKSVVESIFAVIVCDALFSVIFTNLGL